MQILIWILFSIASLVLAYIGEYGKTNNTKHAAQFMLVIALSYLVGFGGQVGNDHEQYVYFFNQYNSFNGYSFIQSYIGRGSVEPLFVTMMVLANSIGLGEAGYFFFIALITNTLFIKVIYKFPFPVFSVLMLIISTYYFQEVNIVRQMLACAFCLYGAVALYEDNLKKSIIFLSCAFLIHASSVLFIIAVVFLFHKWNSSKIPRLLYNALILIWLFSLFIAISGRELTGLNNLIGIVSSGTVYEMYTSQDKDVGMEGQIHYVYNFFILISIFLKERKCYPFLMLFILGGIIENFSLAIPNMTRLAIYFSVTSVFMIPYLCQNSIYSRTIAPVIKVLLIIMVCYYGRELIFNHIFNENELLGSKMYPISAFFK